MLPPDPPSIKVFQSTLSMRRATGYYVQRFMKLPISIHALHEESDTQLQTQIREKDYFNPRSP